MNYCCYFAHADQEFLNTVFFPVNSSLPPPTAQTYSPLTWGGEGMVRAIYLMSKPKEYVMREAPARRSGPQLEQRQVQRTEQHQGYCSCKTAAAQRDGDCQVSPRSPALCRLQVQAPRSACFDGCLPSLAV